MVCGQILAGRWEKTVPVLAHALGQLFLTGWLAEICGRPAYIMNITLEILILGHMKRFFENGFMASGLQDPSLMEGEGAEAAASKTAPVAGEAEFDLLQCRNAAVLLVHGVILPGIGKVVHIVHLILGKGKSWRILDHIAFVSVGLCHGGCCEWVCVLILDGKASGIGHFVLFHFLEGRKNNRLVGAGKVFTLVHRSCHISDLLHRNATVQGFCNLDNGVLAHSVGNQICARIHKNAVLHFIFPVVVVGHSP